jgi:hypothetical protein
VWLRKFYRENVGLEIRRVKAEDFRGIDVCEHVPARAEGRLFA